MTKSKIAASAKLAAMLTEATGMVWEVDESYTNGERVHVRGESDWKTWPSFSRNAWGDTYINAHHPVLGERRWCGMHKGAGWQAKVVHAVVHAYGKVPS